MELPTPAISVITAYYKPDYVLEAYESLRAQEVEWEWLLQCDNPLPAVVTRQLAGDSRVLVEDNPRRLGSAMSRNRALTRCSAPYVFCLDDDDRLAPNALSILLQALEDEAPAEAFGACGRTHTFTDDPDDTTPFKTWPEEGRIPAGALYGEFDATSRMPIHCGAFLWRRKSLLAFGGWAALERSEDTSLVLAANALYPAWYVDEPVYLYRRHDDQTIATELWRQNKQRYHRFARERVEALYALRLGRRDRT